MEAVRALLAASRLGVLVVVVAALAAPSVIASEYRDGKRAYEAGDYDKAVAFLAAQLRERPKHDDAAELLLVVLPVAYERHRSAAEDAEASQDWDRAVTEYKAIAKLTSDMRSLPPVPKKRSKPPQFVEWPILDVSAQLRAANETAAETHYEKGVSLMGAGKGPEAAREFVAAQHFIPKYRDSQTLGAEALYRSAMELREQKKMKEAALNFRAVQAFVHEYKDSAQMYAECRAAAIVRVAVMPFENKSGKEYFGAVGELLSDKVLAKALNSDPEFIEFVNRDQLAALMAEKGQQEFGVIDASTVAAVSKFASVQAFVFGKILTIQEDFPGEQVTAEKENRIKFYDYNTKQEHVLVALFRQHTLKGSVEVTAGLSVVDGEKGKLLKAENVTERRSDEARWITWRGDERAVPQWAIDSQTPGGQRPLEGPEAMVQDAVEALSERLARALVAHFG
ncbi:MAG: hypothetical protein HC882_03750 [Acidobacteria bacterium]|nr:hypothetical protein [Acidobacteriota bacterium]